MKKKWIQNAILYGVRTKMWKIMRLCVFFIFMVLSQIWAGTGYSQQMKITLKMNNVRVIDVLDEIENISDYYFVFNQKLIGVDRKVDLDANNETINDILNNLFSESDVNFTIKDHLIILSTEKTNSGNDKILQQKKFISGTVTDEAGEPLPGVTVLIQGTTIGTVTNMDGNYTITDVPAGTTLLFSFIGMATQEIVVGNQLTINVKMMADVIGLDEVVAIGYGSVKRSDLTGSVSSIKAEDMENIPSATLEQKLQGRAAGLYVVQNNGAPGAGASMRIRGGNSIQASNEPLYVIDGFIGGSINAINPNDIESVEVLKDASSTAIYGARAANGVIIVTTKKGTKGAKPGFEFNYSYGLQNIYNFVEPMNGQEFARFYNTALINAGLEPAYSEADIAAAADYTDWLDLTTQTGKKHDAQVVYSGGSDNTNYYLSANYYLNKGTIKKSEYDRKAIIFNLNSNPKDRISLEFNAKVTHSFSNVVPGGGQEGILSKSIKASPLFPAYNEDGSFFVSFEEAELGKNPLATLMGTDNHQRDFTANIQGALTFEILKDLKFRTSIGWNYATNKTNRYWTRDVDPNYITVKGKADVSSSLSNNVLNENLLTYQKTFNSIHKLDFLAGFSYQEVNSESFGTATQGFSNDNLSYHDLSAGTEPLIPRSGFSESTVVSWLGRMNYNLSEKYLLTANVRYDGSSRFASNHKYAFFPSGAVAWRISEESVLKDKELFHNLKLRVSYGLTGNQAIDTYQSIAKIQSGNVIIDDNLATYYFPTLGNDDLKWEKTAQFDIGFDVAILDGNLEIVADYYHKLTTDLLLNKKIPVSTGFSSILTNVGSVKNTGVEIGVNTHLRKNHFSWDFGTNISFNQNEVVEVGESNNTSFGTQMRLIEGEPLGTIYGWEFDGIWQLEEADEVAIYGKKPGQYKYVDQNNDDKITLDDDRIILGKSMPDFFLGVNNDFAYKNWSLNVFLQGAFGHKMINSGKGGLWERGHGQANQIRSVIDAWRPDNPVNDIRQVVYNQRGEDFSSRFLEDASYLRVKNISLSYQLSDSLTKKIGLSSAKIFTSVQNAFTFTNYTGFDPETGGGSSVISSSDYGSYPQSRTFSFGVNIGF